MPRTRTPGGSDKYDCRARFVADGAVCDLAEFRDRDPRLRELERRGRGADFKGYLKGLLLGNVVVRQESHGATAHPFFPPGHVLRLEKNGAHKWRGVRRLREAPAPSCHWFFSFAPKAKPPNDPGVANNAEKVGRAARFKLIFNGEYELQEARYFLEDRAPSVDPHPISPPARLRAASTKPQQQRRRRRTGTGTGTGTGTAVFAAPAPARSEREHGRTRRALPAKRTGRSAAAAAPPRNGERGGTGGRSDDIDSDEEEGDDDDDDEYEDDDADLCMGGSGADADADGARASRKRLRLSESRKHTGEVEEEEHCGGRVRRPQRPGRASSQSRSIASQYCSAAVPADDGTPAGGTTASPPDSETPGRIDDPLLATFLQHERAFLHHTQEVLHHSQEGAQLWTNAKALLEKAAAERDGFHAQLANKEKEYAMLKKLPGMQDRRRERDLDEAQEQRDEMEEALGKAQGKLKKALAKLVKAREQLDEAKAQAAKAPAESPRTCNAPNRELDLANREIAVLAREKKNQEEQITHLHARNRELANSVRDLKGQLRAKDAEVAELGKMVHYHEEENEALARRVQGMDGQIRKLKEKLTHQRDASQYEKDELEGRLAEAQERIRQLQARVRQQPMPRAEPGGEGQGLDEQIAGGLVGYV